MNTPLRTSNKTKSKRISPYGNRRGTMGCFAPFKSPLLPAKKTDTVSPSTLTEDKLEVRRISSIINKETLISEVKSLKKSIEEKNMKLEKLNESERGNKETGTQIDKLHTYNELKDIAQMVMGKLAEIEETTSKEMYKRFCIDLSD